MGGHHLSIPGPKSHRPFLLIGGAALGLLAALVLAAFQMKEQPPEFRVVMELSEGQVLWRGDARFDPARSDGEPVEAGDTLGWALDPRIRRELSAWTEASGQASLKPGQVIPILEELGWATRIPDFIRLAPRSGPLKGDDPLGAGPAIDRGVDSLETALYRLRRRWQEATTDADRGQWAGVIRETEAQLNRARAARDQRIQGEERAGKAKAPPNRGKVDLPKLRVLADSLLAAALIRAPGAGIMTRSAAGPGTWELVLPGAEILWLQADIPLQGRIATGQTLELHALENGKSVHVTVEECHAARCRIRGSDLEGHSLEEGAWILPHGMNGAQVSLLRHWLAWKPGFQPRERTGPDQG